MIVIIDYGLGNVRSILAKYEQMGEEVLISNTIEEIEMAERLILPGVGAFGTGMEHLADLDLIPILTRKVKKERVPILGICLGMQLLTNHSEEGSASGLGYIDAETRRFSFSDNAPLNIPHMGWNTIQIEKDGPLFAEIPDNSRFYFVHSYHVICSDKKDIGAVTQYGYDYSSVIQKENIVGVQFHPEKSHKQGIQLLRNFARL